MIKRTIFVTVENTPNPDSLKFFPERVDVLPEHLGTRDFPTLRSASNSPLAQALFTVDGIRGVFMANNFVAVNKDPELPWHILKPLIIGTLTQFFQSGKPVLIEKAEPVANEILEPDSDVVAQIKEILQRNIIPYVQEDGGNIEFRGFKEGVVLLQMQGSCSSCPSSQATLKGNVERMLIHFVPEVTAVLAVSDTDLENINLDAFKQTEETLTTNPK